MDRHQDKRGFLASLLVAPAGLVTALEAYAQASPADFPNKPVRWIVPTSPGAGTDFAARSFALVAGDSWKQPVVVDNKSGASGMIGLDSLAAAAPDGYTQSFISVSQFLDAILLQKFAFDARKDLTPISLLASTPLILVANASTGISSLQQLIAAAKSRPKTLNYSSGGSGGLTHFAMEVFLKKAGLEVTHVPYKGSGPAVVDLLGGQVQISFSTPAAIMQHVKAGRLRALAVASDTRSPLAPDIPTFLELGLKGVSLSAWYGLFGPANMPPEIVERIARTVTSAARPAAVREKMLGDGIDPILSTPAEFTRYLRNEREQWLTVARDINFQREK